LKNGKILFLVLFYYIFKNFLFHLSDACCIASNGAISWSTWCNLYYEIRPPSICDGYEPPAQGRLFNKIFIFLSIINIILAWFGGDPHIQTSNNTYYSCNVFGTFIYAQTTSAANTTAKALSDPDSIYVQDLASNELFSIIARTSKTPSLLQIDGFFNNNVTYFSSFSMYLGSNNEVIIDVDINSTDKYQFSKEYLIILLFFFNFSNLFSC